MSKHTKPENPFKFFERTSVVEARFAPTNLQRAVSGETAILGYMREGHLYEDCLRELLCDLMYWARFAGFDFDAVCDEAKDQYDGEYES